MEHTTEYITNELINKVFNENDMFENEYQFQFALGWAIKEKYPELKVKIEEKAYCDDEEKENCRCDIVAYKNDKVVLLAELKYVVTTGAQSDKSSIEARSSFISDIIRLQDLRKESAQKFCIFVTNKTAVYSNNSSVKGIANYFNKKYAIEYKWHVIENLEYKNQNVKYLIVNVEKEEKPES